MGRRKRVLDDGDDSDSSNNSEGPDFDDFDNNDPDAREERALFEDPYKRKRRRKNGKEDALYGVFAEDSDEDGPGKRVASQKKKRSDWAKAPAFIPSDKKVDLDLDQAMEVDLEAGTEEDDGAMEDADSSDNSSEGEDDNETAEQDSNSDASEPSRPTSTARLEPEEEEEERPSFGGLGSFKRVDTGNSSQLGVGLGAAKGGIGSSKGGIGSGRGGIGTYASFMTSEGSTPTGSGRSGIDLQSPQSSGKDVSLSADISRPTSHTPSAFSGRQQRFTREETPAAKPLPLSAEERAHFSKIQNSFGARMLEKMGWEAGKGLGAGGEGIVTPIESKLRPQKMGIAFKGFKEKTDQSKREARRRGEVVSDEEDPLTKKMKKKAKEAEKKRSDVWKKPKKVKTKIEHKSYEQIIAEAGEPPAATGLGQIIDATGAVPREVSSLADVSVNRWGATNDPTRIPEVRHNIRLIADACKSDLDGLAREAKALQERKDFVTSEDTRLRRKIEEEAELISRMQQIQLVANEIQTLSKELASVWEVSLEPFSPHIKRLVDHFPNEFDTYQLDEIVVAAIAPLLRRMVASWNPLEEPTAFLTTFRNWRRALRVNANHNEPPTQVDVYGTRTTIITPAEATTMTPFESVLWNVWLPKVRTAVNNEWSAEDATPAVKLYEAWSSFLPPFIRDNMLDQLFLPKVQKAIADWNPKRSSVSLQSIVFPWLPHIGLRLDSILEDARRKVKSVLKSWVVSEGKPEDLRAWKDVFGKGEWDTLMLKYIVPKLGETLRTDFRVYPPAQNMDPFNHVMAWSGLLRPSIVSQILETEFFPKWLDVLHLWLIQPNVSFEEVARWYEELWKPAFPESIRNLANIQRGFTRGLQLMNDALALGPEAPAKLKKPDFRAEMAAASKVPSVWESAEKRGTTIRPSARTQEITFRSIVEEYAAGHDLLFIPTGRAHEKSRMPLFRVSSTADGKHGLLVYILDDAVWAPQPGALETDEFRAIGLEDMVARAKS